MPVSWDTERRFKLLLHIIGQNSNLSINWEQLAQSMGPEYTVESVKQALKKIKKDAATTGTPAPDTPIKKGTPRASRSSRKRKQEDVKEEEGEHDEETEIEAPVAKKKSKSRTVAKDKDLSVDVWLIPARLFEQTMADCAKQSLE